MMSIKETIKMYEERCQSLKEEYDNLCQVRDWLIMLNEMREIKEVVKPATGSLNSDSECGTYDESYPPEVTYLGVVNKFNWKTPIK